MQWAESSNLAISRQLSAVSTEPGAWGITIIKYDFIIAMTITGGEEW